MKTILTAGIALALALPAAAQESRAGTWFQDWDKASAAAQEQGKDLLVDFTGTDW